MHHCCLLSVVCWPCMACPLHYSNYVMIRSDLISQLFRLFTQRYCLCNAAEGSFLKSFLADSASMNPDERGHFLEQPPEGAPDIDKAHEVKFSLLFPCSTSRKYNNSKIHCMFQHILPGMCSMSPVLPGRLVLSVAIWTPDVQLMKSRQKNVILDLSRTWRI